jgi:multiple sugar transport system ATP-binding protein
LAEVSFSHVGKVYPGGARAVTDLDLEIQDGEFMVLVGPSGCGKTTALRMVAGLESVTEGEVRIGDRVVNHVPSKDRDIAMVFQSYALYPHLKVYDNIAFGLRLRKEPKRLIDERVREAAETLGLTEYLDRRPGALSGGQRQRVAMGRAIVRRPKVFLMDEPLSNLDAKLRVQMRAEISQLQREQGVTTVYVTHDQVEAMTMGDRVAVMRKGRLQQVDTPQEVYDHPVNLFVAGFIGSPSMNLLEARVEESDGRLWCVVGESRLAIDEAGLARHPAVKEYAGRELIAGIRPEIVEDAALRPDTPADRRLRGSVELREALGSEIVAHVRLPDAVPAYTEDVQELAKDTGAPGGPMDATGPEAGAILVGRLGAASGVQEEEPAELAIDTSALHFFDPDSGLAIYDEVPTSREVQGDETQGEETLVAAGAAGDGDAGGGGARRRLRWRR